MDPVQMLESGVRAVLHRWTLLRLALDQGWASGDGAAHAEDLFASLMRLLVNDKRIYQDEIEDLLFESLESNFNTLAEDGSVEEVSSLLLRIRNECAEANFETVNQLIQQAQAADNSISKSLNQIGNTSDADDDDDDADDEDMEAPSLLPVEAPTRRQEPIIDEDGFQQVAPRSRRSRR